MDNAEKTKIVEEFERFAIVSGRLAQVKAAMDAIKADEFEGEKAEFFISEIRSKFEKVQSELNELVEVVNMSKVGFKLRAIIN